MYKYAEIEYRGVKLDVTLRDDGDGYLIWNIYLSGTDEVDLLDMFNSLFETDGKTAADKIESLALANAHF